MSVVALHVSLSATVYYSSGNKSWSSSGFPSWITASDTIYIINADTVSLVNNIRIFGLVSVDSLSVITGANTIMVESSGTFIVNGLVDISQQIHIDGKLYNYATLNVLSVHNDGYIYNEGIISIDTAQIFEHHGGEIEGCGTVLADSVRFYRNLTVALNGDNAAHVECQNFCNIANTDTPSFIGSFTLYDFLANTDTFNCKMGNNAVICYTGTLPVDLILFEARIEDDEFVVLNWTTAMELNNRGFEVLRSNSGTDWEVLGFVSGAGNSTSLLHYSFRDYSPLYGKTYYQLRQLDMNGDISYSEIRKVQLNYTKGEILIYPNPAVNQLYLVGDNINYDLVSISTMQAVQCKNMVLMNVDSENARLVLDIQALDPGIYIIAYENKSVKLLKQ